METAERQKERETVRETVHCWKREIVLAIIRQVEKIFVSDV